MKKQRKVIVAILGSTRKNSANEAVLNYLAAIYDETVDFFIYKSIHELPHFNPDLASEETPECVNHFRQKIEQADGVIICTPEYVFSLPGTLKNALEWTVSTIIFSNKPVALITASASGDKAHESLTLIMQTLGAKIGLEGRLLIKGVKGKIDNRGQISDENTKKRLKILAESLIENI